MLHRQGSSNEIFTTDQPIVTIAGQDIESLKSCVDESPRKRVRACAHQENTDAIHEMLIVSARGTYVRPHKHLDKVESFHVVEGRASIVLFDEEGSILRVVELGDYQSGECFFYRLNEPLYHSVLIHSEVLVIHETTNGPFTVGDAIFAPWAPDEMDTPAALDYAEHLRSEIGALA